MARISANEDFRQLDPARRRPVFGSWRDEKVEDPFDDPKVRQRIAELIIQAATKEKPYPG